MKGIALAFVAALILATPVCADDLGALRAAGRLTAVHAVKGEPPLDPADPAWNATPAARLLAYPQIAVPPGFKDGAPIAVEVRALVGAGALAVRLTWPDPSEDRWQIDRTNAFADAAAVQFAPPSDGLPYIGMGEPRRPVRLWLWRAGRAPELLQATGFGTLVAAAGEAPEINAIRSAGAWIVVLRGLAPSGPNPLPLALALWDGRAAARAGQKRSTAWHLLALPQMTTDATWLKRLREEATIAGDAARGRALMSEYGCLGCHAVPGGENVESGPNLAFAGGLHWPGYLRRSIREPSAFVVPHPAYRPPDGDRHDESLMPRLDLSEADLSDLAAYLTTLR